ncbi:MAG: flavodoxin-dependent (E)-4-hydroxy-3-methylbut-2-enyl-diphosphate synthase, partial [Centipeda sp. (in: firmicutes)]
VEERLRGMEDPIEVAVMGCVVNGPGEARGADVGIAGGNGEGLIFRKGEVVRKVKEKELLSELFREIDAILEERKSS